MEEEHKRIFAQMQKDLAAEGKTAGTYDPDEQTILYVRAFADGVVFDAQGKGAARLGGPEPMREILQTAIGMEKETIAFYTGLEGLVPPKLGRSQVRRIIREEMGHVTLLTGKLQAATK